MQLSDRFDVPVTIRISGDVTEFTALAGSVVTELIK